MSGADVAPTQANGYPFGRPDGRAATGLDETIRAVIESLPFEVRLYPDVYAWKVADAVNATHESTERQESQGTGAR